MPLETATYISELVTSNPAASDGMNNADDHMRLTKAAVKNSLPNISGAVTATHTELNSVVAKVTVDGVGILAQALKFKDRPLDTIASTEYGRLSLSLSNGATTPASVPVMEFSGASNGFPLAGVKGNLNVDRNVTATLGLNGPGQMPIGAMVMWLSNTLPPTTEGVWCWANGAALSRATYSTAFERMGTTFGAGDGSTTFNVINMQEVAPVGRSTMGGSASPGLLSNITQGLREGLGLLFGAGAITLAVADIPAHYHSGVIWDPTHSHAVGGSGANPLYSGAGQGVGGGGSFGIVGAFGIAAAATGVRLNSSNGFDTTYSAGGGGAHNNVQPSRAVNFIVRIA